MIEACRIYGTNRGGSMLTKDEIIERYKQGNTIDYLVKLCTYEDYIERQKVKGKNKKEQKEKLTKNKARLFVEQTIYEYIRQGTVFDGGIAQC